MWKHNPSLIYDANGGIFDDYEKVIKQTFAVGSLLTKPEDPRREEYTFKGWSKNPDGGAFANGEITLDKNNVESESLISKPEDPERFCFYRLVGR